MSFSVSRSEFSLGVHVETQGADFVQYAFLFVHPEFYRFGPAADNTIATVVHMHGHGCIPLRSLRQKMPVAKVELSFNSLFCFMKVPGRPEGQWPTRQARRDGVVSDLNLVIQNATNGDHLLDE